MTISRMIKLSEKAERHLSLHFGNSNSAGSVFFTEVFANPSELLNYVNTCEPSETIVQAGNREALIFHMAEPVGNQEGMGMLGFCYVAYHFVYDLAYPVLVQVYYEDEFHL